MAVFHQNICKFNACGRNFLSLCDLIKHIEENHIDLEYESKNQQYLPASCVLRICSFRGSTSSSATSSSASSPSGLEWLSTSPDQHPLHQQGHHHAHHHHHNAHGHHSHHNHQQRKSINSPAVSLSTSPTGSELDEDLDDSSDQSSIDSWATPSSGNSNPLIKYHQIMNGGSSLDVNNNSSVGGVSSKGPGIAKGPVEGKIYNCNFSGCPKFYRNLNSLNHHRRTTHKIGHNDRPIKPVIEGEAKPRKEYKCVCNKIYKTSHGLKNHMKNYHSEEKKVPAAAAAVSMGVKEESSATTTPTSSYTFSTPMLESASNNGSLKLESDTCLGASPMIVGGNDNLIAVSPTVKESLSNIIRLKNSQQQQQQQQNQQQSSKVVNKVADLKQSMTIASMSPVTSGKPTILMASSKTAEPVLKTSPLPMLSAPTLQQHLLSPIVPKIEGN